MTFFEKGGSDALVAESTEHDEVAQDTHTRFRRRECDQHLCDRESIVRAPNEHHMISTRERGFEDIIRCAAPRRQGRQVELGRLPNVHLYAESQRPIHSRIIVHGGGGPI
jgi:hypothetical protein